MDSTSEDTVNNLLREISRLDGEVQRSRGVRELVAAVLYGMHGQTFRLKPKEFAIMNQLSPKLFNRKYVAYQNLYKRQVKMRQIEEEMMIKKEKEDIEVKR